MKRYYARDPLLRSFSRGYLLFLVNPETGEVLGLGEHEKLAQKCVDDGLVVEDWDPTTPGQHKVVITATCGTPEQLGTQ